MKKTWNIYGLKVKVKIKKNLVHPETGEPCMGLFDPDKATIWLNEGMDEKQTWSTITHEVVHAMQFRLGYFQTMPMDFLENMAETFGNMIAENFKWTK